MFRAWKERNRRRDTLSAIENNDILKAALSVNGISDLNVQINNFSLLVYAITHGASEIAYMLLDLGADPNQSSKRGGYPLYASVVEGNQEIFRALLQHGADPWYTNGVYPSALGGIVYYEGRTEFLRILEEEGFDLLSYGLTPLHLAVISGEEKTAKHLIDTGYDHPSLHINMHTLIVLARIHGHQHMNSMLEKHKADTIKALHLKYGMG